MTDASETVIDGLTNFAQFMQDINFGKAGGLEYRAIKSAIDEAMTPSDVCVLAFSTIILDQNTRPSAFVVIVQDRVIVAWKRGAFRKVVMREVIPFSSITSVQRVIGEGALRAANLMWIDGASTVTIALPTGPKDVFGLVVGALKRT